MKPLIVLLTVFGIAVFALKIATHTYDIALSARIAMSAMLLFTAVGHFVFTKGMTLMIEIKGLPLDIPVTDIVAAFTPLIAASILCSAKPPLSQFYFIASGDLLVLQRM